MRQTEKMGSGVPSPMSDLMIDVISILQDKPKGLEALEQHPGDGRHKDQAGNITERKACWDNGNIGELQQNLMSLLRPPLVAGLPEREILAVTASASLVVSHE